MFHWRKRHPTQLHPEWPSSGKEVLIGFLHHYSPQTLKANLTLDLSCKKRLSTSFAKEDGKKIMTRRIEWKKGNEKGGKHIDLQLPCVSNHVKRGVPCDQSSGRVISHTSSCWSGELRKLWIRSGFEGPLHHVWRDLRLTAPAFDLARWGCSFLSRLWSTQEININNSVSSPGRIRDNKAAHTFVPDQRKECWVEECS